ncbi:MAG: hybrid sensor histidine kinase/response regulator [Proteobacteria bacterium]|nr:hybrid sensor histidine kinase/response regulator [Pseudomonadota bacterium]
MTKILAVDDDKMILKITARRLEKMGYHVIIATDGKDALKCLAANDHSIHLVLLDHMMPEMDGITTYEQIQQINPFLPVIMTTAHGSLHLAIEFMKRGGTDFVQKPLDFDILELKIRQILKNKQIEQKIRETEIEKRIAQEAENLKNVIAASASHELRTPLNFIRGLSQSLKHAILTGDTNIRSCFPMLKDIGNAWSILNAGVNDLIEIALIEKGHPLNLDPISVPELIQELIVEAQNKAFSKGFAELSADIEKGFPILRADRKKLKRVLSNILDNAVKHTNKGTILIKAMQESGHVTISVSDSGMGIPENIKGSVFYQFTHGSNDGENRVSGVGLYITKKLVDLMNGTIWFESRAGEGTTFFISLPVETD